MILRAALFAPLLLLAACGGPTDTASTAPTAAVSDVGDKATADVDAALADAQRTASSTATTRP